MSTGADISALYREFTDALTEVGRIGISRRGSIWRR